jgi:hypothetical protein
MQLWQVLARFLQSGKPVTLRTMAIAGCTGVGVGMIVAYIMMGTIHSVRHPTGTSVCNNSGPVSCNCNLFKLQFSEIWIGGSVTPLHMQ